MSSSLTWTCRTMNPKSWHNSDQVHTILILKLYGMEPTREIRLWYGYVTLARQMREMCSTISLKCHFLIPSSNMRFHVLRTCSLYEDYRHRWSQRAKTCFFVNLEELFTDASLIKETTKFLVRANILNSRRFPKKEVAKTHPLKTSCDVPVTPQ